MPLGEFSTTETDTRLIRNNDTVYKIKVEYCDLSGLSPKIMNRCHGEIEEVIRAVLYASERNNQLDKPIVTQDCVVTVTKTFWRISKIIGFKQHGHTLKVGENWFQFKVRLKEKDKENNVDSVHRENVNKVNGIASTDDSDVGMINRRKSQSTKEAIVSMVSDQGKYRSTKKVIVGDQGKSQSTKEVVAIDQGKSKSTKDVIDSDQESFSEDIVRKRKCTSKPIQIVETTDESGTEQSSRPPNMYACSVKPITLHSPTLPYYSSESSDKEGRKKYFFEEDSERQTKQRETKSHKIKSSAKMSNTLRPTRGEAKRSHGADETSSCEERNGRRQLRTRTQRQKLELPISSEDSGEELSLADTLSSDVNNLSPKSKGLYKTTCSRRVTRGSSKQSKNMPLDTESEDSTDNEDNTVHTRSRASKISKQNFKSGRRKKSVDNRANVDDILGVSYKRTKFRSKLVASREEKEETVPLKKRKALYNMCDQPLSMLPEVGITLSGNKHGEGVTSPRNKPGEKKSKGRKSRQINCRSAMSSQNNSPAGSCERRPTRSRETPARSHERRNLRSTSVVKDLNNEEITNQDTRSHRSSVNINSQNPLSPSNIDPRKSRNVNNSNRTGDTGSDGEEHREYSLPARFNSVVCASDVEPVVVMEVCPSLSSSTQTLSEGRIKNNNVRSAAKSKPLSKSSGRKSTASLPNGGKRERTAPLSDSAHRKIRHRSLGLRTESLMLGQEHSIASPRSDETKRLRRLRKSYPLTSHSGHGVKFASKDRHVVEQEELQESMKLQSLAQPSPTTLHVRPMTRSSTSGLWNFVNAFVTPVKHLLTGGKQD